jgi:prepilin-type N-terminal cleavage/methylation domain-containing protein
MRRRAFTLMEIIVVVTIIALAAAISIPNLLRARLAANESQAIAALRTIASAAHVYRASHSTFPADLEELVEESPPYIDSILANGTKQGYSFSFSGDLYGFEGTAEPLTAGLTGNRYFYVDASGVIRSDPSASATNTSDPLD